MNCQGILFNLFWKLKSICESVNKTINPNQQRRMGGCRCIFRDCHINSSSYPGMHFFHFPIKQKEKLDLWIKYAKADHILNLTPSQMKNKVVCNTHFRDECFMNYKKDRLTREAIPTLVRLGQPNMVLDYEISDNPIPTKLPNTTAKHLVPPSISGNDKTEELYIESCESETDLLTNQDKIPPTADNFTENYLSLLGLEKETEEENVLKELKPVKVLSKSSPEPTPSQAKKLKTFNAAPKILNRNANTTIHKVNTIMKLRSPNAKRKAVLLNGTKTTKMYKNLKKPVPVSNLIRQVELPTMLESALIDIQEIDDHNIPIFVDTPKIINENENDILEKQKLEYEKQIEELKAKLKAKDDEISKVTQIETVSTSKQTVPCTPVAQPKQASKVQLFNGIKKYLCPSMSALVRMEMFSEPERDWKSDEKQASVELLQLGDTVFDYFRDEWRFRLPPKKEVEQWMSANADMDDDDDL